MPTAARLHWVPSAAASTRATHCARPEGHCSSGLAPWEACCALKLLGHGNLWSLESLTHDPQKDACVRMCVRAHVPVHTLNLHTTAGIKKLLRSS